MAVTQLSDVTFLKSSPRIRWRTLSCPPLFSQSGVVANNALIAAQLSAGAESFSVPFWNDLPDIEAGITNDDPTVLSTPQKISANKQTVRKSFLHASWSEMSLASELSGDSTLARIQDRVTAYESSDREARHQHAARRARFERREQRLRHWW